MNTTIFATLKRWFPTWRRSPPPPPGPLGLNPDQVRLVRSLPDNPAWRAWEAAVDQVFRADMERLFQGLPHDDYLLVMGRVQAIRQLASLPALLDAHGRAQQEARTRHDRSDPSVRPAAFYGTGWFNHAFDLAGGG